ncbi:EF-hand domain-containing protein [Sphingosinicella sp. LHD-64]|uniref:EF-hand domain-containing protein n=1 Tax=Sphingosinicella sp. LHD-64 TaxID=3072139 RepID=UPI00280FC1E1|nr:EF-hand domain-containing protein [Sphingosinicella sp. LHD-64]MDQ8755625.1 EF-hand domain-containing protein [Sphingosinicella sp. LHD-64]
MYRPVLFASALLLAAPLLAQDTQPPPSEPTPSQSQPPASEPSTGAGSHSSPFGVHDTDHNGSLSRAEFTAMVRARAQGAQASEADIAAAFQRADTDGNGEISGAEAGARQASPQ